ncbi:MAG TPA: sigma-70 family RNA polymerase sigma factor, partial [Tepidisphaeraceae bacterium]|nr:sigma-70 family RNA polymerase sigma factor [Tepidisphaeraceae bacterium]
MSSLSGAQYEADPPPPSVASSALGAGGDSAADLELVRKARRGDRGAYGQLVVLYQDRIFNAVLRLVGDPEDARELAQEAFARGLNKIQSFRGESSPYTWLFRIAMNLAISSLRRVQRHKVFSLEGAGGLDIAGGGDGAQPAAEAERREEHQQVAAALGRLDADYRIVLVLRDIEGFD